MSKSKEKKTPYDDGPPPVPAYWLVALEDLTVCIEWLIRHLRDPNPLTTFRMERREHEIAEMLDSFMHRSRVLFELRDEKEKGSKK